MNKNIPEEAVTDKTLKKVAQDVTSEKGQQLLLAKRMAANKIKDIMDKALSIAAKKLDGKTTSRIKDIEVMQKKIAQKRISGREYGINDINDAYGGRLIIDKTKREAAKKEIQSMAKQGLFKINKEEEVKNGEYNAYHYDIQALDGAKGEIQIHSPQSVLEAVSNHTLRADYGDMPKGHIVSKFRGKQADVAHSTPNDLALAKMREIQSLEKKQDGRTTPMQTASILASSS